MLNEYHFENSTTKTKLVRKIVHVLSRRVCILCYTPQLFQVFWDITLEARKQFLGVGNNITIQPDITR